MNRDAAGFQPVGRAKSFLDVGRDFFTEPHRVVPDAFEALGVGRVIGLRLFEGEVVNGPERIRGGGRTKKLADGFLAQWLQLTCGNENRTHHPLPLENTFRKLRAFLLHLHQSGLPLPRTRPATIHTLIDKRTGEFRAAEEEDRAMFVVTQIYHRAKIIRARKTCKRIFEPWVRASEKECQSFLHF